MRRLSLRARLLLSYLAVVVLVAGIGIVMVWVLTPELFERGVRNRLGGPAGAPGGRGPGPPGGAGTRPATSVEVPAGVRDAYDDALLGALAIAAGVGLVVAVVFAVVTSRRVLRPVRDVQHAVRRLADGGAGEPIPVPPEPELAGLVGSVNDLGASLAAAERARARLVSDLAHELRNPLTTIEGYMEGLIDGVLPATTETFTEVAEEAHRLKRLTEDLSVLSRAQEGAMGYQLAPIDLADVVRRVAERLRPQFEASQVRLVIELDEPLPVTADEERMAQVLTNLLGNALGHTAAAGSVVVRGTRRGDECMVTVADDGEGIPPDQLEVIFERFTRAHGGSGLGLGLNIARAISRAHGGDVTAASPGPGRGATFTVVLPARRR